jgi:hypothetical protein
MGAERTIGIALLLLGGGLGVFALSRAADRHAAQNAAEQARLDAETVQARWSSEQHALEKRALAFGIAKPLLAAVEEGMDRATLVTRLESADWWREARSEFSVSRVIVGTEVLVTVGAPELGTHDRDVVLAARGERLASAVVMLNGRPCFLVAARLSALPARAPVLVLAKEVDTGKLGAISAPPPVPVGSRRDSLFVVAAVLLAFWGVALLAVTRSPVAAGNAGSGIPSAVPRDPTLRMGTQPRALVAPGIPGVSIGGSAAAPLISSTIAPPPLIVVRPPSAVPATPGPVGPPRRPTVPGGLPLTESGAPGTVFGRYQLLDRLGAGGMSEVFTAVAHGAEGFSRVFVLKRLKSELANDKEAMGQFIDEARMQASLVHSNIVPVFDFGQVGTEFFMTQEYIVGRDLVRLIARRYEHSRQTISPRFAYFVVHETLLALQHAHTKRDRDGQPMGIVHRDVSPANVIVSAQGEVKLSDFGIVKSNKRVSRTQAGMVKGNVTFMSPEQAKGKNVDGRSDLFSVGLVLYYCLTNQFLYEGDNDLEILHLAATGPTAAHRARLDGLPSPAREILGRALEIEPDHRFQTAAEFADQLTLHIGGAKAEATALMKTLFGDELLREAA